MLNDLYPLLTTVQPAQLNMTLNALSTALEGRGDELGENLETVDAYLKRINPQIPDLVEDLRLTAQVSDTYADVLPEVAQILDNTVTTATTLEGREAQLHALFTDISVVLRHRAHVPRRERRRAGAARQGQRRPAAGAGALLPRVPVPDPGPGQRRQAGGGGVPRVRAAHHPRDAAAPAPRLQAAPTSRAPRTTAVPTACTCRTRPGASPTPCGTSPTSTTASTSRPARAPRGCPFGDGDYTLLRQPGRRGRAQADARRRPASGAPTSAPCWPARWWGRLLADGTPRQEDHQRPDQAGHLPAWSPRWRPACW